MSANVYTKDEILQNLASKGHFIEVQALDNLLEKWQIEAIFEDDQGSEFFDKNSLDMAIDNYLATENARNKQDMQESIRAIENSQEISVDQTWNKIEQNEANEQNYYQAIPQEKKQNFDQLYTNQVSLDNEANEILNNIALSDGTPLMEKVQSADFDDFAKIEIAQEPNIQLDNTNEDFDFSIQKEHKMGILEGAMIASGQEYETEEQPQQIINPISAEMVEEEDFDDMSLLSESYEAQEKFREYVVSELSKKNMDLTPTNEFKLDISEKTLDMIAKSMAKKIAKHVSQICSADAKASARLATVQDKNERLENKLKELEEQNKKLRLLLVESNRNLNSYKPSILGLYKKVPPEKQ